MEHLRKNVIDSRLVSEVMASPRLFSAAVHELARQTTGSEQTANTNLVELRACRDALIVALESRSALRADQVHNLTANIKPDKRSYYLSHQPVG
jgi:hypothetical protein